MTEAAGDGYVRWLLREMEQEQMAANKDVGGAYTDPNLVVENPALEPDQKHTPTDSVKNPGASVGVGGSDGGQDFDSLPRLDGPEYDTIGTGEENDD